MASRKKTTFEERMKALEMKVAAMESGGQPLEDTLKAYETGMKELRALEEELAAARQKLTVLRTDEDGEDIEVPMEDGSEN